MNAQAIVERLGFRPSEARVYVALIGLHEASVSDVARKINIPRTTVQGILEDLHKQGLANFYTVKNRKVWCSESPRKLLVRHQEVQKHLSEIIPTLEKMRPQKATMSKTFNLEGRHGIRFVLDDILVSRESVSFVGNLTLLITQVGHREWQRFLESAEKHISSIRAVVISREDIPCFGNLQVRYGTSMCLPDASAALMITYGDKTVFLSEEVDRVGVTIMQNSDATELMQGMCNIAWQASTE